MANKNSKVLQAVSYIYEHIYMHHSPQRPVGESCTCSPMHVFGSSSTLFKYKFNKYLYFTCTLPYVFQFDNTTIKKGHFVVCTPVHLYDSCRLLLYKLRFYI